LWLGIVPRERVARVAQDLVNDVAEHGIISRPAISAPSTCWER
jgi:hypothetical protein